jgi:alpha-L-arabinofuranosidase
MMDGLSLHNYTLPGGWNNKRSALEFDERDWFETLERAMHMDELITRHSTIMDQYDPKKRVGMIVDEWGTWFLPEPGTNPGFLYQQNTMRDALVAAIHLHIFQKHCDRVHMANLAQMVNVLQAVVLTEGEKMLLTPTYHVLEMFKVHQDAEALAIHGSFGEYAMDGMKLPQVSVSASKRDGMINISLCNLDPAKSAGVELELRGCDASLELSGTILAADDMHAHNTFEAPERVKTAPFTEAAYSEGRVRATLPSASVAILRLAPRT